MSGTTAAKRAALAYLDDVERSYAVAREARGREFEGWWDQASEEERLAWIDLLIPGMEPLHKDREAAARAAEARAAMDRRREAMRERQIAASRAILHWRLARSASTATSRTAPRARGAGRPARRRVVRSSACSGDSGDGEPGEPAHDYFVGTLTAREAVAVVLGAGR